jgi:hypothetical protein
MYRLLTGHHYIHDCVITYEKGEEVEEEEEEEKNQTRWVASAWNRDTGI